MIPYNELHLKKIHIDSVMGGCWVKNYVVCVCVWSKTICSTGRRRSRKTGDVSRRDGSTAFSSPPRPLLITVVEREQKRGSVALTVSVEMGGERKGNRSGRRNQK